MLRVGRRRCTGSTTLCARATGGARRGLSRTNWGVLRRRSGALRFEIRKNAERRDLTVLYGVFLSRQIEELRFEIGKRRNSTAERRDRTILYVGGLCTVGMDRSALRFANAATRRPASDRCTRFRSGLFNRTRLRTPRHAVMRHQLRHVSAFFDRYIGKVGRRTAEIGTSNKCCGRTGGYFRPMMLVRSVEIAGAQLVMCGYFGSISS
ncbi:hypothetical protein BHE74_00002437, partial [Ensete ventricosum]